MTGPGAPHVLLVTLGPVTRRTRRVARAVAAHARLTTVAAEPVLPPDDAAPGGTPGPGPVSTGPAGIGAGTGSGTTATGTARATHVALDPHLPRHPSALRSVAGWVEGAPGPALLAAARARQAVERGAATGRLDAVVAVGGLALGPARELARRAGGVPVWADLPGWVGAGGGELGGGLRGALDRSAVEAVCRRELAGCRVATTSSEALADLCADRFGVRPDVVRDTWPDPDRRPAPTGPVVRVVHAGPADPDRGLRATVDAVRDLGDGWTLDLHLVPGADGGRHLRELHEHAATAPQVRIHDDAALPDDLPALLAGHDVAVWWAPPTTPGACAALPELLLAAVQARLAVAVGPAAQAERVVRRYGLGAVSVDVFPEACAASLRRLGRAGIDAAKAASDAAAPDLDARADDAALDRATARLLAPQGA